MKEIIVNNSNLKEEDITEIVTRVKALLINSNNELLLGYSHNDYQFPGGHVEENEKLTEALSREITEETGIILDLKEITPYAKMIGYYKDYPANGKNRKIVIYYYEVKTDEKPNLNNTNYTEEEKDGHFRLEYINLNDIENKLQDNAIKYGDKYGIASEMLKIIKIYKNEN